MLQGKEKPSGQSSRPPSRGSKKAGAAPVTNSWKLVAGFFVFLAVGITLMQVLSGTNPIPPRPSQKAEQPAANMQVVPQIEEMERQVAANPNNHEQIVRLANFLQDNRFYDRAIKYYKDYLAKHPNDANARVDMGVCYNDLGNLDEARKQIELVIQNEPKHLFAHFNLGIVLLRGGDVEKANESFKQVIALDPKSEVAQRAQQLLTQHNPQNLQPN
ncbi:MAG TPA: tetratricopeptide repeat protein [Bacteroidota bacterium]|nr:tetratricopeptide repeat protein [Bacteroidota bacterium]